jgi:2-dehydro-3-deoxyphosphogluconate aldolase / (4S)-4-hydroxy-2-oxoglutarate aldolase
LTDRIAASVGSVAGNNCDYNIARPCSRAITCNESPALIPNQWSFNHKGSKDTKDQFSPFFMHFRGFMVPHQLLAPMTAIPLRSEPLNFVLDRCIVAVIRAESPDLLVDVAEALVAGGVEVMEVTFTVPHAAQVLEDVAAKLGNRILLGAGTVLDPETARVAILSGAEFIVSPGISREVIELCRRYSKLAMPGALTPTEVITAWQAGADIVKIFPSELTGPKYIKSLKAPLPQVRLMPTGGVNLDTATEFLAAGACALGIGSSLVEPKAVASGDLKRIESLASQYVQIVKRFRTGMKVAVP